MKVFLPPQWMCRSTSLYHCFSNKQGGCCAPKFHCRLNYCLLPNTFFLLDILIFSSRTLLFLRYSLKFKDSIKMTTFLSWSAIQFNSSRSFAREGLLGVCQECQNLRKVACIDGVVSTNIWIRNSETTVPTNRDNFTIEVLTSVI